MRRPYIGVSGFMSADEVHAAIAAYRDAWAEIAPGREPTHDLMVGVLASSKTLAGQTNKYPLRYPRFGDIASIFQAERDVLNLVHYASVAAPDSSKLYVLMLAGGPWCHGFQFNVSWPSWTCLTKFVRQHRPSAAALQPSHEGMGWSIVLQAGPRMLANMGAAANLAWELDPYIGVATDVLIDASGGEGRAIDAAGGAWIGRSIGDRHNGKIGIGVAGGLCAETLTPEIGKLLQAGCSIDAEGRLRDGADGGGNLDLDKVRAYLRAAVSLIASVPA